MFVGYEGLRSDAERSVSLITNSNICAPLAEQSSIIAALANDPGNPMAPCISNFPNGQPTFLPAATGAFGPQYFDRRSYSRGESIRKPMPPCLEPFHREQFERDGGLFPFQPANSKHQFGWITSSTPNERTHAKSQAVEHGSNS